MSNARDALRGAQSTWSDALWLQVSHQFVRSNHGSCQRIGTWEQPYIPSIGIVRGRRDFSSEIKSSLENAQVARAQFN